MHIQRQTMQTLQQLHIQKTKARNHKQLHNTQIQTTKQTHIQKQQDTQKQHTYNTHIQSTKTNKTHNGKQIKYK